MKSRPGSYPRLVNGLILRRFTIGLPMLERMFRKREKGYKAMGYQLVSFEQTLLL